MRRLSTVFIGLLVAGAVTAPLAGPPTDRYDNKDRIFVTNRDGSVSLIQRDMRDPLQRYREVDRYDAALTNADWPANQYSGAPHWWWVGTTDGHVWGFNTPPNRPLEEMLQAGNFVQIAAYTYPGAPAKWPEPYDDVDRPVSGSNFSGGLPNGKTVWNAAREIDEIQEIDADPHSPTFGTILTNIPVPSSGYGAAPTVSRGSMRPCDMSITPNGKFLFEPDLGGETVTAVDIKNRTVVDQLYLPPLTAGTPTQPFMLSTNGEIALVENLEGTGTYAVIDVRDPYNMREIKRLTAADHIGIRPTTSEFSPHGKFAYMIANGSSSIPGTLAVFDLDTLKVLKQVQLPTNCRPNAGDFSKDGQHFFAACTNANLVAVVDTRLHEVIQEVPISGANPQPRGVLVR